MRCCFKPKEGFTIRKALGNSLTKRYVSGHFKGASSSKACRNLPWASTSTNLPRIGWIEDDCGEILKIPNFVFSI